MQSSANSSLKLKAFYLVLALAGAAFFASLAWWQWQRAGEKKALMIEIAVGSKSQVAVERVLAKQAAGKPWRYQGVTAQGHWLPQQFLLDNMSYDGMPGYQVLTPMCCVEDKVLIVNRGWIPWQPRNGDFSAIAIDGVGTSTKPPTVTINGQLVNLPEPGWRFGEPQAISEAKQVWPRILVFPEASDLSEALGRPVHDAMLWLSPDAENGFVRDWQINEMGPYRHLGYAIQWAALMITVLVIYIVLTFSECRNSGEQRTGQTKD